jgi:hypothetical protein
MEQILTQEIWNYLHLFNKHKLRATHEPRPVLECGSAGGEAHLGAHLRLHHRSHHSSTTSGGVFHFHFKCLPALIQKLKRDKLVSEQSVLSPKQL